MKRRAIPIVRTKLYAPSLGLAPLRRTVHRPRKPGPALDGLTNREVDILELLSSVSRTCPASPEQGDLRETVHLDPYRAHLKHIYQKLAVRSRREAVRKA